MKLRSRYHNSKSWHTLNLWWFRLWLQQYPSNKLKHNNVVLSKSMGELIDTFFVILQVNGKLKESWFILQYSTLKIKIKYIRNWKKNHRSWVILIHREMHSKSRVKKMHSPEKWGKVQASMYLHMKIKFKLSFCQRNCTRFQTAVFEKNFLFLSPKEVNGFGFRQTNPTWGTSH